MIATVRGRVATVTLDSAVIEVGGVGILVHASPGTLAELVAGHEATLFTSLVVREDSLTLFGFLSDDARSTFETVQTVSGIGPRLALAMLAVHEPDGLRRAVATEDLVALTLVPGIGRKGAQRLVLELKDRLGPPGRPVDSAPLPAATGDGRPQVRDALVGLGWSAKAADDALDLVLDQRSVDGEPAEPVDVAGLLRAALRQRPVMTDDGSSDATAGLLDGHADPDDLEEQAAEQALRPRRLDEFPGQPKVREQLDLMLKAAKRRGAVPDHVLLSGPPGLGKTTLAMIVAAEIDAPMRITSGPAIQHAGDLAAILSQLGDGEVLFLDEIHRMSRPAEEMLYVAMEDFRVDVVVGKGPGATAIPLELPPFTLVGATTRAGLLPAPLRDRFGFTGHLDYYSVEDLETILRRSARLLGIALDEDGGHEIARRSRGTPRITNRLLRRVRDWAEVHGAGHIDLAAARAALKLYDVDELGLDRLDRAVLEALCRRFGGGPVGLSTLAVAVGEETETVETVAEPYLVREGLLIRTPRGRAATPAGWQHVGLVPPRGAAGWTDQGVLPLAGNGDEPGSGDATGRLG